MKKRKLLSTFVMVMVLVMCFPCFAACELISNGKIELKQSFKTEYVVGEALDTSGGVLNYTKDGESVEVDITDDMISNFSTESVGTKTLTITYKGLNLYIAYTVSQPQNNENSQANEKIELKQSFKTEYVVGEALDTSGGVLSYTKDEETIDVDITDDMVSNFSTESVGNKTLTITYKGLKLYLAYKVTASQQQNNEDLLTAAEKQANFGTAITAAKNAVQSSDDNVNEQNYAFYNYIKASGTSAKFDFPTAAHYAQLDDETSTKKFAIQNFQVNGNNVVAEIVISTIADGQKADFSDAYYVRIEIVYDFDTSTLQSVKYCELWTNNGNKILAYMAYDSQNGVATFLTDDNEIAAKKTEINEKAQELYNTDISSLDVYDFAEEYNTYFGTEQ